MRVGQALIRALGCNGAASGYSRHNQASLQRDIQEVLGILQVVLHILHNQACNLGTQQVGDINKVEVVIPKVLEVEVIPKVLEVEVILKVQLVVDILNLDLVVHILLKALLLIHYFLQVIFLPAQLVDFSIQMHRDTQW